MVGANLAVTNAGTIAGGKSGDAALVQADAIDFTGGTTNSLQLGTTTGTIYTQGTLTGALGVGGTLSIDPGTAVGTNATLANTIHDYSATTTGSLGKTGAGTLTLSGTNTYSGDTTISAGVLDVQTGSTVAGRAITSGALGTGTVTDNATLQLQGEITVVNALNLGGTLESVSTADAYNTGPIMLTADSAIQSDTGTLTASGAINDTVTNTGIFTVTGALTGITSLSNDGTFTLGGNSIAVGALTSAGASGDIQNGSATTAATLTVNQAGTMTYAGTLQNGGNAALALAKTGAGTLKLSDANGYSGGTQLDAGTLDLAQQTSAGTGALAFAAGTSETLRLDFAGTTTAADALEAPVTGFAAGDVVDLSTLGATGATASYHGGTLTVTNAAGQTDELQINAAPSGYQYDVVADTTGGGGTDVVLAAITSPTITGTHATADAAEAPVPPFSGVTVSDGNQGASDTLTIALSGGGGTLAEGAGHTNGNGTLKQTAAGPDGSYTLAGTAGQITAELDALVFTPANGTPGATASTTFALTDASSAGPSSATNTGTTVNDVAAAVPPTITNTSPPATSTNESPRRRSPGRLCRTPTRPGAATLRAAPPTR